jgi:hypothetical protein
MRSEQELETTAERIYWLQERGQIREAVRALQEVQKDALEHAHAKVHNPKDRKIISAEMAALPC